MSNVHEKDRRLSENWTKPVILNTVVRWGAKCGIAYFNVGGTFLWGSTVLCSNNENNNRCVLVTLQQIESQTECGSFLGRLRIDRIYQRELPLSGSEVKQSL